MTHFSLLEHSSVADGLVGTRALELKLWNGIIQFIIHILIHQFNSCAITHFQVTFQFDSKFNPEVYTIQYEFHINAPNSKQFHVGKSYTMYFFNISTIIGVSSFIFFLVYLLSL